MSKRFVLAGLFDLLLLALLAAPAAAENAFGSAEQERALIANICGTQMALGEAGCACLAERAMAELDENQRGYLILSVVQPPAADRMGIARSQEDLTTIFTMLEAAQTECTPAPAAPAAGAPAEAPAGTAPAPQ